MTIRGVSYGGGRQSTALLVLAVEGRIDFPLFLFANVGERSEHPATLAYVRDVAVPYAAAHGVELVELRRLRRDGSVEDLRDRLDAGKRAIPVRRHKDGPPMSRSCTADFKLAVIGRELKRRGANSDAPATVAIGIAVDEIERAKTSTDSRSPWQVRCYPLLDLGLHTRDCVDIIKAAGLPVPPKSACFFCPFHDREAWRRLKRETPALFAEAVSIERTMSTAAKDGRPVYLTRSGVPLDQAIDDQQTLFGDDGCDTGWCMT